MVPFGCAYSLSLALAGIAPSINAGERLQQSPLQGQAVAVDNSKAVYLRWPPLVPAAVCFNHGPKARGYAQRLALAGRVNRFRNAINLAAMGSPRVATPDGGESFQMCALCVRMWHRRDSQL